MTKVGNDILCYCGRCKLQLAHTVLALVDGQVAQVRCNTCNNVHANQRRRNAPAKASPKSRSTRKTSNKAKVRIPDKVYDEKLKALEGKTPRAYGISELFEIDDVIDHPSFGRGFVLSVKYPDRIDVMFKNEVKGLIHNKK